MQGFEFQLSSNYPWVFWITNVHGRMTCEKHAANDLEGLARRLEGLVRTSPPDSKLPSFYRIPGLPRK